MHLTSTSEEERAVSPVIGVILMVAITVILAAVIGTFVLGLGDQVSQSAPQATINAKPAAGAGTVDASTSTDEDFILLNHRGGDTLTASETTVKFEGTDIWDGSATGTYELTSEVDATFTSAPTDLSTAGTWTIVASPSGSGSADTDITGTYTVTLVDQPSSQIIADKDVNV